MIKSISIIVPVYNELKNLRSNLKKIIYYLKKHTKDYEIIIIDSGSKDGSQKFLKKYSLRKNKVRPLFQKRKEGWGSACKLGLKKANKKYCFFYPIDDQYKIKEIIDICKVNKSTTITYRKSSFLGIIKFLRSFGFKFLCKLIFQINFKDINSIKILELKYFNSNSVIRNFSNDWFFDLDILLLIKKKKFIYSEYPINLYAREYGKSNITFLVTAQMFLKLFFRAFIK
jgi:glycosyltransferase involved in cell wall biosynthesis